MSDLEKKITSITHKISALTDSLNPKSCPDEILFTRLIECKPHVQQVEKTLSEIKSMIDIKSLTFVPSESLKDILNKRPNIGCLKTDWLLASKSNVPTQTETESQIPKQKQTNLSQKSKAQLDYSFEKTQALGRESAAKNYMPTDPRAHGFNVGARVKHEVPSEYMYQQLPSYPLSPYSSMLHRYPLDGRYYWNPPPQMLPQRPSGEKTTDDDDEKKKDYKSPAIILRNDLVDFQIDEIVHLDSNGGSASAQGELDYRKCNTVFPL